MENMDKITQDLLNIVTDTTTPPGAFNIRKDGGSIGRQSTKNVKIVGKTDKPGIDIIIGAGTKGERIYIPALITHEGVDDLVYNDFFVGDDSEVVIVAGCGVHNGGCADSQHNGIHRFFIGKNARVVYIEKHIGLGVGTGKRIINPETYAEIDTGGYLEMDTVQIEGVDSTRRMSKAIIKDNGKLIVKEKIMTHDDQFAETNFEISLDGPGCGADLVSRSVAKDNSKQIFRSIIHGNTMCTGHSECDAIIMDNATVSAIPELTANHLDAALIHEAAIGKIAGDQIIKLMTLGLTEEEAEARIVEGFMQ